MNTEMLIAIIFRAKIDFGYTFSEYKTEYLHNGINPEDLPTVLHVEEEKLTKIGETILTDGQLRQAMSTRKYTVAKFLDVGENWHCFFMNFRSINGEEKGNNGQPHYHYISSAFGISRTKVVEQLKSRHYKFSSLPHIDFTRR